MILSELTDLGLKDKEIIKIAVEQLNMSELDAKFALAIERGEVAGDLIKVDEDGNEMDDGGPTQLFDRAQVDQDPNIQLPPKEEAQDER